MSWVSVLMAGMASRVLVSLRRREYCIVRECLEDSGR